MTSATSVSSYRVPASVPPPVENYWALDVLGDPAFATVVYGQPAQQGSKNLKTDGRGHTYMYESASKNLRPWRDAIRDVCRLTSARRGWRPLDGCLVCDAVFTRKRTSSAPKKRDVFPNTYPDLDKYLRALNDGLKLGGIIADDARITDYRRAAKRFVGSDDPDALPRPGVLVRIWRLGEEYVP